MNDTTDEELQPTKREQILSLYESGTKEIAEIVRQVKARPSYVAHVLQNAGHLEEGFGLYGVTEAERNVYTRFFRNVPDLTDADSARESCVKLTRLYDYFERLGDRADQHQATVVALTGKNRARWSGKLDVSEVFGEWLSNH